MVHIIFRIQINIFFKSWNNNWFRMRGFSTGKHIEQTMHFIMLNQFIYIIFVKSSVRQNDNKWATCISLKLRA